MNNGYEISDLIEIGSAEENILSSPVKDIMEPEELTNSISRPSND